MSWQLPVRFLLPAQIAIALLVLLVFLPWRTPALLGSLAGASALIVVLVCAIGAAPGGILIYLARRDRGARVPVELLLTLILWQLLIAAVAYPVQLTLLSSAGATPMLGGTAAFWVPVVLLVLLIVTVAELGIRSSRNRRRRLRS